MLARAIGKKEEGPAVARHVRRGVIGPAVDDTPEILRGAERSARRGPGGHPDVALSDATWSIGCGIQGQNVCRDAGLPVVARAVQSRAEVPWGYERPVRGGPERHPQVRLAGAASPIRGEIQGKAVLAEVGMVVHGLRVDTSPEVLRGAEGFGCRRPRRDPQVHIADPAESVGSEVHGESICGDVGSEIAIHRVRAWAEIRWGSERLASHSTR